MQNFSCKDLSFYYGKKLILDGLEFNINEGDVIALVGLNGSGKTTFLKLLTTINLKVSFSVFIEKPNFYPSMTGYQNLYYFNMIYDKTLFSINEALNMVDLYDTKDKKFKEYSLGMKCKLAIAKCLIKDADIYIFDEPLNGLDAYSITIFRNVIDSLKRYKKTIIISSHILSELDRYCNKLFIIDKRKLFTYDLLKEQNKIENIFLSKVYR